MGTDNFTYSNGNLPSGTWDVPFNFQQIVSNTVQTVETQKAPAYFQTEKAGDNRIGALVTHLVDLSASTSMEFKLYARADRDASTYHSQNHYFMYVDWGSPQVLLYKVVAGSSTFLNNNGSLATSPRGGIGASHTYEFEVLTVGGNAVLNAYIDGVLECTYTDSSSPFLGAAGGGYHGFSTTNNVASAVSVDSYTYTDAAVAVTPEATPRRRGASEPEWDLNAAGWFGHDLAITQWFDNEWVDTSGGGASGSLAKTNANDTSAASGTTTVVGALTRTNSNDTSAATGTTTVTGSLAKTNANDTVVASGSVGSPVSGTLATTNANDTSAATGTTTVVGSLARTNSNDTSAASGTTTVTGTLAKTNANDTSAATGTTTVVGTLAKTNANDTSAASGTVGNVTGTVAYTNANDTSAGVGTTKVLGTSSTTNANDTSGGVGTTKILGTAAIINANDVSTANGQSGNTPPPVDVGSHTGGYPKARHFPEAKRLPLLLPTITGTGQGIERPDRSHGVGQVDPFNLLAEDEELLLLI